MMVFIATVLTIAAAAGIQFFTVDVGFNLQVFYFMIAVSVFVMALRSNSMLYLVLGVLLFSRWAIENYEYQWSPIAMLACGHFTLSVLVFYTVRGAKQRFLFYFPALIVCQGLCDIFYYHTNFTHYGILHNVLAIMQMSAFVVLAWQRSKITEIESDPIVNLMNRLSRDWLAWRQNGTRTFPHA